MTPHEQRVADLELEFQRLKGRADYLDRMLMGHPDSWVEIRMAIPDGTELVIDRLVAEGRQTALAMTTIAARLASMTAPAEQEQPAADPLDELERKRKEREQKAAGG